MLHLVGPVGCEPLPFKQTMFFAREETAITSFSF